MERDKSTSKSSDIMSITNAITAISVFLMSNGAIAINYMLMKLAIVSKEMMGR